MVEVLGFVHLLHTETCPWADGKGHEHGLGLARETRITEPSVRNKGVGLHPVRRIVLEGEVTSAHLDLESLHQGVSRRHPKRHKLSGGRQGRSSMGPGAFLPPGAGSGPRWYRRSR